MIVLTLGYNVSPLSACSFKDVEDQLDPNDPLYPAGYVAACAAAGITVGKTPDTFAPYDNITRAQLITMVARAADCPTRLPATSRPSENSAPTTIRGRQGGCCWACWTGSSDMGPGFDFWAPATRAEVCLLLAGLLE